jgi:hypothetical protein
MGQSVPLLPLGSYTATWVVHTYLPRWIALYCVLGGFGLVHVI